MTIRQERHIARRQGWSFFEILVHEDKGTVGPCVFPNRLIRDRTRLYATIASMYKQEHERVQNDRKGENNRTSLPHHARDEH